MLLRDFFLLRVTTLWLTGIISGGQNMKLKIFRTRLRGTAGETVNVGMVPLRMLQRERERHMYLCICIYRKREMRVGESKGK